MQRLHDFSSMKDSVQTGVRGYKFLSALVNPVTEVTLIASFCLSSGHLPEAAVSVLASAVYLPIQIKAASKAAYLFAIANSSGVWPSVFLTSISAPFLSKNSMSYESPHQRLRKPGFPSLMSSHLAFTPR